MIRRGGLVGLVGAAALLGCGPPAPSPPPAPSALAPEPPALDAGRWGDFRSERFDVLVPLPDGRAWKIDDRRTPWLTATHEATGSSLIVRVWREDDLVSRQRCEERARGWREIPAAGEGVELVERRVVPLPAGFDTVLVAGVRAAGPGKPLLGFVTAFGGWARRCFAYVFTTRHRGRGAERVIGDRLATMVEGSFLKLDVGSDLAPEIPR